MTLKGRILKEMLLDLDIVRQKLARDIYENIKHRQLKPEFEAMTPGELLDWIEKRIGETGPNPALG